MNEKKEWKWKRLQGASTPDLYANMVHLVWTLDDVTARIGQLVADSEDPQVPFAVREMANITFSWRNTKLLRNNLNALIESYEKANGEINLDLKLAPSPE